MHGLIASALSSGKRYKQSLVQEKVFSQHGHGRTGENYEVLDLSQHLGDSSLCIPPSFKKYLLSTCEYQGRRKKGVGGERKQATQVLRTGGLGLNPDSSAVSKLFVLHL